MKIAHKIPTPILQKIPVNYIGLPWYQRLWRYAKDPIVYTYVKDWKIELPNGDKLMVPKGESTDGASIPWFLRPFATSFGPLIRGACLHDFGYKHGYLLDWEGKKLVTNKGQKFFDDLFRDVVIWSTGLKWLAWWAWSGVRVFGWIAWNNHRDKQCI